MGEPDADRRAGGADDRVRVALEDAPAGRGITLSAASARPLPVSAGGLSALYSLPGDFRDHIRMAVVLSEISGLDVSVRADTRSLSLEFRFDGMEIPMPSFKYSDPTTSVPAVAAEILALFR